MLRLRIPTAGKEREEEDEMHRRLKITILKLRNTGRMQAACRSDTEAGSVCTYIFLRSASLLTMFQFPLLLKVVEEKLRPCFHHPVALGYGVGGGCCSCPQTSQHSDLFKSRWTLCYNEWGWSGGEWAASKSFTPG